MKKILMMMALFIAFGANADNKFITKNYDYTGFTGIQIGNAFEANIVKSDSYTIKFDINEKYEEYLRVKVDNGVLKISLENVPIKKFNISSGDLKVTIALPEITMLKVSGACKVYFKGDFSIAMGKFKCYMSGASKVYGLNISCSECNTEVSGASHLEMATTCDKADIEIDGASKILIQANANEMKVDARGAAKAEITGIVREFDIEGSGASVITADKTSAENAKVDLSGASVAKVNAAATLNVDLSGASKCYYKDNSELNLRTEISRGASLKKL